MSNSILGKMKNFFIKGISLGLLGILSTSIMAQSPYIPPDKAQESTSNAMVFVKNQGQLLDNTYAVRNDVKYYMPNATPAIYAMDDRISLVKIELDSVPPDSIPLDSGASYRVDMQFLVEGTAQIIAPVPVEQVNQNFNYYMSYLPNGSLTNVPGYDRIVYENVWAGIDVHLTTNLVAPKIYFVVHPNADPNDISLGFTGQNNIDILSTGTLEFDFTTQSIQLPELEAYEVDPTTDQISNLSWFPDWENPNNGSVVTVGTGSYDTDNYLVLVGSKKLGTLAAALQGGILNWSTYIGTQGRDVFEDLTHDPNSNNDLVAAGFSGNINIPSSPGQDLKFQGGRDGMVSKFEENGRLVWVAYYGTKGSDAGIKNIAVNSNGDIFFSGTISNISGAVLEPSSGNFNVTTRYGSFKGNGQFVIGAIKSTGKELLWASYFGNDNASPAGSIVTKMTFDNNDNLYLVGHTNQTSNNLSFPITARAGTNVYNQSTIGSNSGDDGFIARFSSNLDLTWLTYYGGSGDETIFDITINPQNDIFFVGETSSATPTAPNLCLASGVAGQFPLCNANGGSVARAFVHQGGLFDGFVAHILANGQLNWSRYMGGSSKDALTTIACNNTDDNTNPYYISVAGNTVSSNIQLNCDLTLGANDELFCKDKLSSKIIQTSYESDLFITKFDASFDIDYATYLGGEGAEKILKLVADETNSLVGYCESTTSIWTALTVGFGKGHTSTNQTYSSRSIPICPGIKPYTGAKYFWPINPHSYGLNNMHVESANGFHRGYVFNLRNDEKLVWATFFGSKTNGFYRRGGMTLTSGGDLYVGQTENSKHFPIYKPNGTAYVKFSQGNQDAFISKFSNVMGQNLKASMKDIEPTTGELQLFPNPSASQSILRSTGENIERYSIYDVSGKLIEKRESNAKDVQIDVSNKSQGIYIIEAETENKKETKKLIVK